MIELIYGLCNKNDWFTCGTTRQYDRMFSFASCIKPDSITLRDDVRKLAVMIWICSDNFTEDEIYSAIITAIAEACGFSEGDECD